MFSFLLTKQTVLGFAIVFTVRQATMFASSLLVQAIKISVSFMPIDSKTFMLEPEPWTYSKSNFSKLSALLLLSSSIIMMS